MLKIPTFVLGGLLILTGLVGYLFQDRGLSIKLTGPFANDAKLTLSDGTETHEILVERSVFASSDAPGEHAYWLIRSLNTTHANEASKINYAVDQGQGSDSLKKKSFWYASSRGETLAALMLDSTEGLGQVDKDSSTIRFVYKNAATNSGPPTLQVSNWKNIDIEPKPKPNEKLEFGKSWTPLIPGIIGIVLILLVLLAEAKPNARKHVMHGAVLFGLLSFAMVAKRVWPAISEMNWLKGNDIYPPPLLKPSAMLISAGILLIFVILCVVSFIQARKDMAAQAKKEALTKKKESKDKPEDKGEKKKEDGKDKDATEDSDTKDDSDKPKRPDASGDPAKESTTSKPKGLSIRKPVDQTGKKASFDLKSKKAVRTPEDSDDKDRKEEKNEDDSEKEDKKDPGKDDEGAREKPKDEKGGDSDERKDSDEQPDKNSPSPVSEESEETQEKNEDDSEKEPKKDSEKDTGFSYKKPEDGTSGDSGKKKDSDEQADKDSPSPAREESEEIPEKKKDDSDAGKKEKPDESKDSSNGKPEEK